MARCVAAAAACCGKGGAHRWRRRPPGPPADGWRDPPPPLPTLLLPRRAARPAGWWPEGGQQHQQHEQHGRQHHGRPAGEARLCGADQQPAVVPGVWGRGARAVQPVQRQRLHDQILRRPACVCVCKPAAGGVLITQATTYNALPMHRRGCRSTHKGGRNQQDMAKSDELGFGRSNQPHTTPDAGTCSSILGRQAGRQAAAGHAASSGSQQAGEEEGGGCPGTGADVRRGVSCLISLVSPNSSHPSHSPSTDLSSRTNDQQTWRKGPLTHLGPTRLQNHTRARIPSRLPVSALCHNQLRNHSLKKLCRAAAQAAAVACKRR